MAGDAPDIVRLTRAVYCATRAAILGGALFALARVLRHTLQAPERRRRWTFDLMWVTWVACACFAVLWLRLEDEHRALQLPPEARAYAVLATDRGFSFRHPGEAAAVPDEVWVQAGVPAAFTVTNERQDPIGCYIPALRVARTIAPGASQTVWFAPLVTGAYRILSTGTGGPGRAPPAAELHVARLHVVDGATFAARPWRR